MKKILVLAGGLMIMIAACKKDKTEPTTTTPTATVTPTPTPTKVTYETDIKTIINANCAVSGCHVASAQSPAFTSYTVVKSYVGTILLRMGQAQGSSGFMPKNGTKVQANIDKINQWKTDGLLEQ